MTRAVVAVGFLLCVPSTSFSADIVSVTKTFNEILCVDANVEPKCASEVVAEQLPIPFHFGKCADTGFTVVNMKKDAAGTQPDCPKTMHWTYYTKPPWDT